MAEIGRQCVAINGYSEVISVLAKRSTELVVGRELPRPARVLLSEIVDSELLGEGILPTLRHAMVGGAGGSTTQPRFLIAPAE